MECVFAPDVIDWENREAGRQLPSENLCHPRHFWQRLRLRTILCGSRPDYKRTYLRTAAGINGLRRLKQSAAPSSMERLAPRFAFAECDYPDVVRTPAGERQL